jgi:hypothetical protein
MENGEAGRDSVATPDAPRPVVVASSGMRYMAGRVPASTDNPATTKSCRPRNA